MNNESLLTEHPVDRLGDETRWVHRLARALLRDGDLAEDVAQDALVVALTTEDPGAPAGRGWLYGVTRRLAHGALRGRRQRRDRDLHAAQELPCDDEERTAERLRLHEDLTRAVRELPEPYRTAVTLRFFDQLAPRAIARRRGITANAVRQQVHRGLAMLRLRLDGTYGDRSRWVVLLSALGIDRPPPPFGEPRLALPALFAAGALVLAAGVVAMVWWSARGGGAGVAATDPARSRAFDESVDFQTRPQHAIATRAVQDPRRIRELVDRYVDALAAPGLFAGSVLVARGNEEIVAKAWGAADRARGVANTPDTACKLMSTTKAFTAVAVLRLVQQGGLALDDRAAAHVPGWPEAWAGVTVHDLLDHRSGIPNLEAAWGARGHRTRERGREAFAGFVRETPVPPLEAAPGTRMQYSNFNYELAGVVAEHVSGVPLPQLMRRDVLGPAGLQHTGYDDGSRRDGLAVGYFLGEGGEPKESAQDMSVIRAAGGLWSTVRDLHRFDRALAGTVLLDDSSKRLLYAARGDEGYACGWQTTPVRGQRCLHHSGGSNGYVTDLLRFPDHDVCIAVVCNHAFAPIGRISDDLAAIVFGVDVPMPVAADDAALAAFAGVFGFADGSPRGVIVRRVGDLLVGFDRYDDAPRCSGRALLVLGDGRCAAAWGDGEWQLRDGGLLTPQGALARAPDPVPAWRDACGEYRTADGVARLVHEDGHFVLHVPVFPHRLEVVPYTADRAMTMVMSDLGTALVRQGRDLQWTDAAGTTVRLERAP